MKPELTIDGYLAAGGDIPEPFGPVYPDLGIRVAKSRRNCTDARAHGLLVLETIRRMNDAKLARVLEPERRPNCASGTWYSGEKMLKAVRDQNAAACRKPAADWYSEHEQRQKYDALMREKAKRNVDNPQSCT